MGSTDRALLILPAALNASVQTFTSLSANSLWTAFRTVTSPRMPIVSRMAALTIGSFLFTASARASTGRTRLFWSVKFARPLAAAMRTVLPSLMSRPAT